MASEVDYDTLLGDLYGGLLEPDRFRSFIKGLGDATGCHLGTFLRQDMANPSASALHFVGVDAATVMRYESEFAGENIWMERTRPLLKRGVTLFSEDHVPTSDLERTRYYNDYLRGIDTAYSVGICADMRAQRCTMLTLTKSKKSGGFDTADRNLLVRITPHFVNVQSMLVELDHLRLQIELANRRKRAIFLLDASFRWIGGNETADWMVSSGWWRGNIGARIDAKNPISRAAWKAAQKQLEAGHPVSQAIPIYDTNSLLIGFATAHAYGSAGGEDMPCYALFARTMQTANDDDVAEQLRGIYRLTTGEVTLIAALRRHGELAEAANTLNVSKGTARTRLQSIFEKTGIHRQSDLIRMLDTLADVMN